MKKIGVVALFGLFLAGGRGGAGQTTPSGQPASSPQPAAAQTVSPSQPVPGLNLSPASLDFGDHDIGTTSDAEAVQATNAGKTAIELIHVLITGDFTESHSCSKSLGPGEHCVVSVMFSPTDTKARQGLLTVEYRGGEGTEQPTEKATVALQGKGFVPLLKISPRALDFGQQTPGSTSAVRTVTLTARPDARLKISAAPSSGDFSVTPLTCDLEPSASCALSVTFAPKQFGASNGSITLTVSSDGTPTTKVVALSGEGVACCTAAQGISWQDRAKSLIPVVIVVVVYFLALLLVRWNLIILPTRRLLQTQIDSLTKRIETLKPDDQSPAGGPGKAKQLLEKAGELISRKWKSVPEGVPRSFFGSTGQELAGWGYVHEAEEQIVPFQPEGSVRAALERAGTQLREAATPTAIGLADRIHEALTAVAPLPPDPRRPVLQSVLSFLSPHVVKLAAEVEQALVPGTSLDPDRCRELVGKVIALFGPSTASLREQIKLVQSQAPPTPVDQLSLLLQQAADFLELRAMVLPEQIKQVNTPQPPGTGDQWRPLLVQIRDYLSPRAELLAKSIELALAANPAVPLDRWRALLAEALGFLYDRTDTGFATLASWHSKTLWLIISGLLLIVALAAALQHEVFFLIGAAGGLLSRLSRSLHRENVPTDYGASWTTLFLSPVVGALAAWGGILLAMLGVDLNVLGSVFKVDWCHPYCPTALGVALLLGASERAFDTILNQLEGKMKVQSTGETPAQPAGPKILTPATLTKGKVGQDYTQKLEASGGTSPYKWSTVNGTLPDGLSLDPTGGRITGKPKTEGTSKFTLQVTDNASKTTPQDFTLVIDP